MWICAIATRQDSLITAEQMRALGLGRGAIQNRVKRGVCTATTRAFYGWGVRSASPWTLERRS
ncbi:MAG: hypothetical protein WKF42_07030 [Solirubrobacteraceae bacterium]